MDYAKKNPAASSYSQFQTLFSTLVGFLVFLPFIFACVDTAPKQKQKKTYFYMIT